MSVHEYVAEYEFRFDGGAGYTPTEQERAMIEDAIHGYVGQDGTYAGRRPGCYRTDWDDCADPLCKDVCRYSAIAPRVEGRSTAEDVLQREGVFKGMGGLRGLAEASEFWEGQMYGTRLYYGPGGGQYLHRSVLQAAIAALDKMNSPPEDAKQ